VVPTKTMNAKFLPPSRAGATARERRMDVAAWVFSLWFGCGLVPRAPGTAGTVGALPLYWLARTQGLSGVAVAAATMTAAGIWASSRVAKLSGLKDPQFVCVDEVAGVLVTWLGAPPGWKGTIAGLVLFRILDWAKPFPARACERLPGGFGIVIDDVAAGIWGALLLFALRSRGWLD
jgi:phosphatidylglycerophosphatase A